MRVGPTELHRRFAADAVTIGDGRYLLPQKTRRLVALATESAIAVIHVELRRGANDAITFEPPAPKPRALWQEIVFSKNGAALLEIERRALESPAWRCAVHLWDQETFWNSRVAMAVAARGDDELRWQLEHLEAMMSFGAGHGAPPAPEMLVLRDELRAEIARRAGASIGR